MTSMHSDLAHDSVPRDGAGRELDVGALGRGLKRSMIWILGLALACGAMAVGFVSVVQPRYTASAKVFIENGESFFTRPEKTDLQPQAPPDDEAIQSQVQVISSRDLAREALRRLDLKGNKEFDPAARGLDPLSRVLILTGIEPSPTDTSPEDRMLQTYYERLAVLPVSKSRVISIEFTSSDPELAARVANTVAELYIETQSETKRKQARAAADSLASLLGDLRSRAAEAEGKADAFRSKSGLLVGTNNTTISAQQLADVNTQLAQARSTEADAQAKAKLLRDMIRQGRVSEVPDVANNDLIRRISERRVSLKAEVALQSRTLLPGHPHMQELNAQLQDVDQQLKMGAEKAVRMLENDARIAASRVENLQSVLESQKTTASLAGADQVQLNTLELQARLLKEQLEFNTSKYQEALARQSAASTPADARVISRADPPQLPSFPKKLPIIVIATLAGLVLAVGVVIARELMSEEVPMASAAARPEIRSLPSMTAIREDEPAIVPVMAPSPPAGAEAVVKTDPLPVAVRAESGVVQKLRHLRQERRTPSAMRVFVTSTVANRETSRGAFDLGRALAEDAKTIIVDCGPGSAFDELSLASGATLETAVAPAGLSELLAGEATFAEVIHRDSLSRMHVLPSGEIELPAGMDPDYDLVIEALGETYDYLLVLAPSANHPLARHLAKGCDAAVLILADGQSEAQAAAGRATFASLADAPLFDVAAAELSPAGAFRRAA